MDRRPHTSLPSDFHPAERARDDAHDGELARVEHDRARRKRRVARDVAPQRRRHDDGGRGVRTIVRVGQGSAAGQLDAECGEVVAGHQLGVEHARAPRLPQRDGPPAVGGEVGEGALGAAVVREVRKGEVVVDRLLPLLEHDGDAIGIAIARGLSITASSREKTTAGSAMPTINDTMATAVIIGRRESIRAP